MAWFDLRGSLSETGCRLRFRELAEYYDTTDLADHIDRAT